MGRVKLIVTLAMPITVWVISKKTREYHSLHLKIVKEVGDKHGEGKAYCNLGNAYKSLGDLKKAREYHYLGLLKAKEVGNKQKK